MLALSLALLQSAATLNAPPLLATALIAYTSSLAGCLTNYSSGSSVIYFAFGFWGQGGWLSVGGIVGMIYLLVYMTVGLAWWKVIGFY